MKNVKGTFFSDRILRILSEPLLIPRKLLTRLDWKLINIFYNILPFIEDQSQRFKSLNLDFKLSGKILQNIYDRFPFLDCDEGSCHHHFFAAHSSEKNIKNILEIGTYTGNCAVLLSELFPDSNIDTVDLPDDHPVFSTSYDRKNINIRKEFIKKRNTLLETKKNINFLQIDSQQLTFSDEKKYDLIWIDGAHGYPIVTIDIINCLRLLRKDGIMACDDVWVSGNKNQKLYNSVATYETLKSLKDANVIDFELIHKRLSAKHLHPRYRKFIAICNLKQEV